jgi:hypothetical protein
MSPGGSVWLGALAGAGGGALVGGLTLVLLWNGVLPIPTAVLTAIATPAAHLISWLSGWPLEQEAAIMCYALGAALTFVVLPTSIGAVVGALGVRRVG